MKKHIHPQNNTKSIVTCACGNSFSVGSTVSEIHVEICSMCHPFYTGKQKLIDSARRVEKFQERASKQKTVSAGRKGKKVKKAAKAKLQANKKREIKVKVEVEDKKEDINVLILVDDSKVDFAKKFEFREKAIKAIKEIGEKHKNIVFPGISL